MMIVDTVLHKFLLLINFLHLSEGCKKKEQQSQKDHTKTSLENNTSVSTFWIQSDNYPQFSPPDSVSADLRFFPLTVVNLNTFTIRLIGSFNADYRREYFHLQWLDLDLGHSSSNKVIGLISSLYIFSSDQELTLSVCDF